MDDRKIVLWGGQKICNLFDEAIKAEAARFMESTEEQRQEAELNRILLSMGDSPSPATLTGDVTMEGTGEYQIHTLTTTGLSPSIQRIGELILNIEEDPIPQHTEDKVRGYACRQGLRLIEEGPCDNCICKQWRQ